MLDDYVGNAHWYMSDAEARVDSKEVLVLLSISISWNAQDLINCQGCS